MLVRAHQIRSADDSPVSNKMFLFGNECVNDIDFLQIFDSDSEILESKVRGEIVNAGRHMSDICRSRCNTSIPFPCNDYL